MSSPLNSLKTKEIWKEDEIPTEDQLLATHSIGNSLPSPQYEFRYMQSVGTEETYFEWLHLTALI